MGITYKGGLTIAGAVQPVALETGPNTTVTWVNPTAGALGASAGGSSYSFTADVSVTNGVGSTVYSVSSGAVPAGTNLNAATGEITGTLTNTADTYAFTIRATNNGVSEDRSFIGSVTLTITYAISPSVTSVNEGNSVTYTVTTMGVANATTLYWTNEGTTSAADFADTNNTGSFTVTNNTATITRTLLSDVTTEGSETIIIKVRTGSTSGTIVATSDAVTVNDTSIQPVTTYAIAPNVTSVNEGNTVAYTVTTAGVGVADGTSLYWTNNGTTTAADFTEGGSVLFNGTSQYLTVAKNAAFDFGTGNFTVEGWVYLNAATQPAYSAIYAYRGPTNQASNLLVDFDSTGTGIRVTVAGTSTSFGAHVRGANSWFHIAVVRNSGTVTTYINGAVLGTPTSMTGSITQQGDYALYLGTNPANVATYAINAYLTNLRVVNSAVYTAAFTPSTTPLSAITNTSLLLNAKSSASMLTDSSTNAFTVTNTGSATFNNTNPFAGGSFALNGSSQYLTTTSNISGFGTGDFTVEFWINPSAWSNTYVGILNTNVSNGLWVGKNAGNFVLRASNVADLVSYAGFPTVNVWTHVAITRQGTTARIFFNGSQVASATTSNNFPSGTTFIGQDGSGNYMSGKLTNLRIVNGTALYTANFTPPTTELTAVTNTSLLLKAASSATLLTDSSTNGFTFTNNGTATWSPISPVTSSLTDGSFKVYSNSATITRTLRNDLTTEGSESIILNVRTTSTSGTIVATSNTVTVNDTSIAPITATYLAVAGGGGGGGGYGTASWPGGAGGGAGGLLANTITLTSSATYTVTVGNGGAGGTASAGEGIAGTNGANSSIIGTSVSVTVIGGGGGGAYSNATKGDGKAGGSGGGGTSNTTGTGGAGTAGPPRQGYNGGAGGGNFGGGGGGGGGSGAAGTAASVNAGGAGGAGTTSSITGSAVAYAGGGGGSGGGAGAAGAAGAAGGGAGNLSANGGNATVNTGSGGGGGGVSYAGGNGAKGVVILSVPTTSYTGTVTGSPTVTTNGIYTILKFTENGTYVA